MVKSALVFELERLGHQVELEVHLPGIGYCDVVDHTTSIQYEIDGHRGPKYRQNKARKYLRPGIKDIIVIPIYKLSDDLNDIRSFVRSYVVSD